MKYLPALGLILILYTSIEPRPQAATQRTVDPQIEYDYSLITMAESVYQIITEGCKHENEDHSSKLLCRNLEEELYN